jgi:hypothetical protein
MAQAPIRFFALLSEFTHGAVFTTPANTSDEISQLTLDLLLAWMGETLAPAKYSTETISFQKSPVQATPSVDDEEDGSRGFLPTKKKNIKMQQLETKRLKSLADAEFYVVTTLPNLSKMFLDPEEKIYRNKVYQALHHIIDYNVVALTYNAVFGQVCSHGFCNGRMLTYKLCSSGGLFARTVTTPVVMNSLTHSVTKSAKKRTRLAGRYSQSGLRKAIMRKLRSKRLLIPHPTLAIQTSVVSISTLTPVLTLLVWSSSRSHAAYILVYCRSWLQS